jgi:hypothetical protein
MKRALEKFKSIDECRQQMKKLQLEFIATKAAMDKQMKGLQQNKGKKADSRKEHDGGSFAWKGIAPRVGEPTDKTVNGKDYIYCTHHSKTKWVLNMNREGIDHRSGCHATATARAGGGPTTPMAMSSIMNLQCVF